MPCLAQGLHPPPQCQADTYGRSLPSVSLPLFLPGSEGASEPARAGFSATATFCAIYLTYAQQVVGKRDYFVTTTMKLFVFPVRILAIYFGLLPTEVERSVKFPRCCPILSFDGTNSSHHAASPPQHQAGRRAKRVFASQILA
ncbi:hypothetical protein HYQ44_000667 [Verticillium longisporum]|nr:hypothetical protein HYQ44_000667 [Verticillium longisporum]